MMITSVTPIFDELAQRLGLSWENLIASEQDSDQDGVDSPDGAEQAGERPPVEVLES